ncbi:hypothetical protein XA68_14671 [Ophiocordyceps unilateralis]|uniref:Uncharacterized protein n=1 Tax=Ophiocordyceps unilateralis TaxID=268505 RepID=A0A2A9P8S0_OPHUN|nr:hypothetical protein XA68_14671 [Ophiocordyceps unilateralis]
MAGSVDRDSGLLQTSAASPYQVNVNRTKTRKWVEAKAQSYDGDDWGALDYDEPQREPVPSLPTSLAPLPSHRPAHDVWPPSRLPRQSAEHAPPSIQVTTDRHKLPSSDSFRSVSSPVSSRPSRAIEGSYGDSPTLARSPDAYRHFDEDEKRHRRSTIDPLPDTGNDLCLPAVTVGSDISMGTDDKSKDDTFHSADSGADVTSLGERDARRDSVSPQLPDVTRMSSFGPDFFDIRPKESGSSPSTMPADSTMAEHIPASLQEHTLLPLDSGEGSEPDQNAASPTKPVEQRSDMVTSIPDDGTSVRADSPIISFADPHANAAAVEELAHIQARPSLLQPDPEWPSVPPLQTPSPRPSEGALDKPEVPQASRSSSTGQPYQRALADGYPKPRPVQRKPTNSTITPSSVKDSDALSEEILRSLSPSASSSVLTTSGEGHRSMQPASPVAGRESTYTLGDYDSYWDDASSRADKSAPLPPTPPSKVPLDPPATPADGTELRRRFSWEVDDAEAVAPLPEHHVSPSSAAGEPIVAEARSEQTPTPPSPGGDDAAVKPVGIQDVASGWAASAAPDPPSPLSVASDKHVSVSDRDSKRPSLADDKAVAQAVSSLSSPTPPPEPPARLSSSSLVEAVKTNLPAQTRVMAFREVMGMPNVADRIAKFNETRDHVATTDSGLDDWLAALQAQYPEHAKEAAALCQPVHGSPSSASSQPAAQQQQPYYQQYLNASTPGASHSSRSRLGGLPIPSQVTVSSFGHPSNQIGTKSKELMHSAGKMGKGLLSKGKSKLRGSGDKFAPQGEGAGTPRAERRTSWAVSLGRSRPDETVPLEPAITFQGPPPPRTGSLESSAQSRQSVRPRHVSAELDPATDAVVPRFEPATEKTGKDQSAGRSAADQTPEGWILVPSPESDVPADASVAEEEDGGVALQGREAPKRISSFVGLPPIRRSSTFGLTTRAKRASRRFSLDEDDGDEGQSKGNNNAQAIHDGRSDLSDDIAEPLSLVPSPVMEAPDPMQRRNGDSGPDVLNHKQEEPQDAEAKPPQPPTRVFHPMLPPGQFDTSARPPKSPIPGLLTGDWKLEESHLSEPLHLKTRHRPGSGGNSQQHVYCEYDKETGLPVSSVSAQPRQATYATPPSSAHRYPELFSYPADYAGQRPPPPRSQTWGQPEQRVYHAHRPRAETAFNVYKGELGGGVPGWQRGRRQQREDMVRGSGAFASEASMATERSREPRKRQSGFFSSLAGRTSTSRDGGIRPGSPRRPPSSSSLVTDQASAAASQHETRKKKRFSNMAAFSGLKDILQGSGQERGGRSLVLFHTPVGPPAVPPPGLDRSSTTSSFDLPPPQSISENGVEWRRRRSSVSDMISGMLGRRPASKAGEPEAPRQVEGSQREVPEHPPMSGAVQHPGGRPQGATERLPDKAIRAGPVDASRSTPTVTVRPVTQNRPRPSPLGFEPLTHRPWENEASSTCRAHQGRAKQREQAAGKLSKHSGAIPGRKDGALALAGIGALHDGAGEADAFTVSPDPSVVSDLQASERAIGGERLTDEAPGRCLAGERGEARARCPQWSVSSDEISDHVSRNGVSARPSPGMGGESAQALQWRRGPSSGHQNHHHQQQQQQQQPPHHFSHRSESALPSKQTAQTDSRWKGLKNRMSAQVAAPIQNRGDRLPGLKMLGAIRRMSPQREAVSGTGRWGQENRQRQHTPSPLKAADQREKKYEQVPLPKSYAAVQGEGRVATPARDVVAHGGRSYEDRMATEAHSPGRAKVMPSGSPRPKQSPTSEQGEATRQGGASPNFSLSSPRSQQSPWTGRDAVSPMYGMSSSPPASTTEPMLVLPSPPSSVLGVSSAPRAGGGLGVVAHQPSINSLITWSEADDEAKAERKAAELDDTAERYIRSRRLEAQEEKIAYREEDADDYQPQMSATSYPGQEWSPYGALGYEDWRED